MSDQPLLPSDWQVPPQFRDRLGARVGRQRAMVADGHLLLALHAVPRLDEDERRGRFYWRKPDGEWLASGLPLDDHLGEFAEAIDALEDRESRAATSSEYFEVVRDLCPLHHAAGNLYATLKEARQRLPRGRELIDYRDRAYKIQRSAELLYALAKDALEFATAHQSEQLAINGHSMSAAAHRLNMLAAFFFPVVTIATIFGMNFKHGFEEAKFPLPFVFVLVLGFALGAGLSRFLTRRDREPHQRPG